MTMTRAWKKAWLAVALAVGFALPAVTAGCSGGGGILPRTMPETATAERVHVMRRLDPRCERDR